MDQVLWIGKLLSSSKVPVSGQGPLCDTLYFTYTQVQGLRDIWEG